MPFCSVVLESDLAIPVSTTTRLGADPTSQPPLLRRYASDARAELGRRAETSRARLNEFVGSRRSRLSRIPRPGYFVGSEGNS
jgi:hypothetical protein